jgi:hypothetical protein
MKLAAATALMMFLARPPATTPNVRPQGWRDGDIVALCGTSLRSRIVRVFQRNSTDYSHVGIIVAGQAGIFVVHADPAKGKVIRQRWEDVLRDGTTGGAIYRLREGEATIGEKVSRESEKLAQAAVPFDDKFDLQSSDRLYCTELVWRAYGDAGVDLVPNLRAEHKYLLPATLFASPRLQQVQRF